MGCSKSFAEKSWMVGGGIIRYQVQYSPGLDHQLISKGCLKKGAVSSRKSFCKLSSFLPHGRGLSGTAAGRLEGRNGRREWASCTLLCSTRRSVVRWPGPELVASPASVWFAVQTVK
eukprot:GFKZ01003533.1.p1 GENE.GFKZ01003533.1~~GFKZ01003533.1.p1  ORF type:complete len:117 (+),score=1.59 GFKZ01003533.1:55-405(+)